MITTRLAPSPTGNFHIGTLYQALFDYVYAKKKKGGKFILRIEDTDRSRFVKGAEELILKSLKWAGLSFDEGPIRQSERLEIYKKRALDLVEKGFAYYCFCSKERLDSVRKEKQNMGLPPMYDGKCSFLELKVVKDSLALKKEYVIRMRVPKNKKIVINDLIRGSVVFDSNVIDDQVLLKSDGFPTYHLAAVVDDHLMKVTHVIRGEEWLSSSPKHALLYKYFGWKEPYWIHTPLMRNPDKSKLSKRQGHTDLRWYINEGYLPEALLNYLGLIVWGREKGKEIFSIEDMIHEFKFEDIRVSGPIFDLVKLNWINGIYIRNLKPIELKGRLVKFDKSLAKLDQKMLEKVIPLVQERMRKLSEFKKSANYFFNDIKTSNSDIKKLLLDESKTDKKSTAERLKITTYTLQKTNSWTPELIDKKLREALSESKIKPRQFFMPIRVALTGRNVSPPLVDIMKVLGKEKSIGRINKAVKLLS